MSRYTGLDRNVVDFNDMRIDQPTFCRELMKRQKLAVGRLDSRFTGDDLTNAGRAGQFWDPSMAAIRPPTDATT